MQINCYKENKNYSTRIVISTLLLLFTIPLSALAADPDSVAALRQMGKAFSSLSGSRPRKPSPRTAKHTTTLRSATISSIFSSDNALLVNAPHSGDISNLKLKWPSDPVLLSLPMAIS